MIPNQLPFLANHLWQSTMFAAVAGLLTLALRKNRAQMRYWLWLSASVKFLIPFPCWSTWVAILAGILHPHLCQGYHSSWSRRANLSLARLPWPRHK
jgi:hypothetical protein